MKARIAKLLEPIVYLGLFALLAIAVTWPQARYAATHLPTTPYDHATVPLLNTWVIQWNLHCYRQGSGEYWNAPIFWPTRGVTAFTEPMVGSAWMAWPISQWSVNPVFQYNMVLLTALTLNGWVAWRVLREWRVRRPYAVWGGISVLILPWVHFQLAVLQAIHLWPSLLFLWSYQSWRRTPRLLASIWMAGAFGVVTYFSLHQAVLLSLCFLPLALWQLLRSQQRRRLLGSALLASLLVTLITIPLVAPMLWILSQYEFPTGIAMARELAIQPLDWLASPDATAWSHGIPHRWPLSCGASTLALIFLGLVISRVRRHKHRMAWFLGFAAFAFAVGWLPNLQLGTWSPYASLAELYPGLERIRNIYRTAYFFQLGLILSATFSLDRLTTSRDRRRAERRQRTRIPGSPATRKHAIAACLMLMSLVENWPNAPSLVSVDLRKPTWVRWLASQSLSPSESVALWPPPADPHARSYEATTRFMLAQLEFQHPTVNGYSGLFPRVYRQNLTSLRRFPEWQAIEQLRSRGVRFVVAQPVTESQREQLEAIDSLRVLADKASGVTVFELPPET